MLADIFINAPGFPLWVPMFVAMYEAITRPVGRNVLPAPVIAGGFASAIEAATEFAGATAPNPPVGCAIFDAQGRLLACEGHRKAGLAHAEAAAIAACGKAGTYAAIDTIIVTLEPCNHLGRTGPCADAILATPARSVWIGARDPNPHVAGGGAEKLAKGGIDVRWLETLEHPRTIQLAQGVRRLIAPFRKWSTTGRPWITIKQALNRTGSMIPQAGHKTFTSAGSLLLAHKLRRRADAIITGSGTILADNPLFSVRRLEDHPQKSRKLSILDRRGRTPKQYLDAARARGFDVRLEQDIDTMLRHLGEDAVLEALVEAGPTLVEAFLQRNEWDERVILQQAKDENSPDMWAVVTRETPLTQLESEDDVLWYH